MPNSRSTVFSMRWALAGLSLCVLMPSLDTSIANAGLPALAGAFKASFGEAQWIVLSYLLAITTLIVSAGRLGDAIGRQRLLLAGIGVFTTASLLCGVAPTLWVLLIARAVQGLGAAMMLALAVALVGDTVPHAKAGRAMGLLGAMSAVGTTLGPPIGGLLLSTFGWGAIFLVNVPVGVLTFVLARRHLPAHRQRAGTARAPFDGVGTVLLALTLAAYALAMTLGRGHFGSLNLALLSAAGCSAGLFVFVEARTASPLVPVAMFRDPRLGAALAMSVLVSTVMMATLVIGPFYLARSLGLPTAVVGVVLSAGPLVAALSGVPAGRIVDRFGTTRTTLAGLVGIAGGASVLSLMRAHAGVIGYVAPIAVMTSSYAMFQAANNTAIMTVAAAELRGVVAGLLNLSRNLGLITGAAAMGAVFAIASASVDMATAGSEAIAAGMRFTFGVAAALIAVALAIAVGSRALTPHHSR